MSKVSTLAVSDDSHDCVENDDNKFDNDRVSWKEGFVINKGVGGTIISAL